MTILARPKKHTVKYDLIDRMSPLHRVYYAVDAYNKAQSMDDMVYCSELWAYISTTIKASDLKNSCEEAKKGDMDIAKDLVTDLLAKPVKLTIAILEFFIAFAGKEEAELKNALKDVCKELGGQAWDKATDPVKKLAQEKIINKAKDRAREAMLRYLQKVSVRSRKHFADILDKLGATVKTAAGATLKAGEILLTPSQIAPELCGPLGQLEEARNAALTRVMRTVPPPKAPVLPDRRPSIRSS